MEKGLVMLWMGLTGGIASGKSTVSKYIQRAGFSVLDADKIVHELFSPGQKTYQKVVQFFGNSILDNKKNIVRSRLGKIVFQDKEKLSSLEKIVHPEVQKEVQKRRSDLEQKGEKAAFYDVPLLFEKGLESQFDEIILVYCDQEIQVQRLSLRDKISEKEALQRIKLQMSLNLKKEKAGYVIDNNGSQSSLETQVHQMLKYFHL